MGSARAVTFLIGAGLLLQGVLSLALRAAGALDPGHNGLVTSDVAHAAIHAVWGAVLLAAGLRLPAEPLRRLLLAFAAFYGALAVLGLALHHPLGLRLDRDQNLFHVLVTALALAAVLPWPAGRPRPVTPP